MTFKWPPSAHFMWLNPNRNKFFENFFFSQLKNYFILSSNSEAKRMKIFALLIFLIAQSEAIKVRCKFYNANDLVYSCEVELINPGNVANVTDVFGNHKSGKSNANVEGLIFKRSIYDFNENLNIRSLAKGFSNFFPELKFFSLSGEFGWTQNFWTNFFWTFLT